MSRYLLAAVLLLCLLATSCSAEKKTEPGPAQKPSEPEPSNLPRLGVGVHEQTASVPGDGTLRYTISVPAGYDPKKSVPLVVALHYGGEVTPFYGRGMIDGLVGPALGDLGAVIVAPDSQGDDWSTPANEQAVVWLTQSVLKSYALDKKRVLLTGFSMGGQGTWFLGGRHQDLFTAAMPVAGAPADDLDWKLPVYAIHSRKDEIMPFAKTQRYIEKLKGKGVRAELKEATGLTHYQTPRYQTPLRGAVPWLRQVWK